MDKTVLALDRLYETIFYWMMYRTEWRELIFKLVSPDVFDNKWMEDLFKQLKKKFFIDGKNIEFMERCKNEYDYTPLCEAILYDHLEEIASLRIQKQLLTRTIEIKEGVESGKDPNDLLRSFNQLKESFVVKEEKSIAQVAKEIEEGKHNHVSPRMGFKIFDQCLEGFVKERIYVLGAYSGVGKSLVCLQLAYNAARQGATVLFFSLEMSKLAMVKRLMWIDKNFDKVGLDCLDINIVDNVRNIGEIESITKKQKPDVTFVDFIQIVQNNQDKEYARMSENAERLQQLALDANACLVVASQFSNEMARSNSINTIGFKGSGTIMQVADAAIVLTRDFDKEAENETDVPICMTIRKNRFGKGGRKKITFSRKLGLILDQESFTD